MSFILSNLPPIFRSRSTKRVGRGIGCTKGKTCGKGVKGQKARSGVAIKGFEGGQMPIYCRLPKRGFNSMRAKPFELTLFSLNNLMNSMEKAPKEVSIAYLKEIGFAPKKYRAIRLVGKIDKFTHAVNVVAVAASASAQAIVEAAGGKILTQ